MGNWNTSQSDSYDDYNADRFSSPATTSSDSKKEGIAFISPRTGRGSTGNWNVRQAKQAGVQSAVIDGRTLYGSNQALAALGDPSSQFRENVIAGHAAYLANKRAEQRFMDNWIGKDLTSRIREAADAAGIPRSEIPYLGGASFEKSFPNIEEGTAIRFSAGEGDKLGLEDERSLGQKVGDFFTNAFEGKPERELMFTQSVDPDTGLTEYSPTYQVVNENNLMDALASRMNPFVSVDSARLRDPVTGQYLGYSDVDIGLFGMDLVGSKPRIEDESIAKRRQRQELLARSIADADAENGGGISVQTPETFAAQPRTQSLVPMGRDQYSPLLPLFGAGTFGSPSFFTSRLPSLQHSFGLLR